MSRSYALVNIVNCRLGTHPRRNMTQGGQEVSTFNVAYEDGFGKSSKVIWVGCTAYGVQAKLCNRYLYKGACITISGRLSLQEWTDKDNELRSKMHVTIEHLVFNDKMSSPSNKPDGDGITENDINAFDRYEASADEGDNYTESRRYRNTEGDFEARQGENEDKPLPPPFKVPPLP